MRQTTLLYFLALGSGTLVNLSSCAKAPGGQHENTPAVAARLTEPTTDAPSAAGPSTETLSPEEKQLQQRCARNDGPACAQLAAMYFSMQDRDQDLAAAAQRGCDLGALPACAMLAVCYHYGRGVAQSSERAAKLLAPACAADQPGACSMLAGLYFEGTGVKKDEEHALSLVQQACNGNDPSACFLLGSFYATGTHVPLDEAQASSSLLRACRGNYAEGCLSYAALLVMADQPVGPPEVAAEIFAKACDDGRDVGCCSLGLLHRYGKGVPQDTTRSSALLQKSCDAGNELACTRLSEPAVPAQSYRAVAQRVTGDAPVAQGSSCQVEVKPTLSCGEANCRLRVSCGDQVLYGRNLLVGYNHCTVEEASESKPAGVLARDEEMEGDPELLLDTNALQVTLADGRDAARWQVDFALSAN